MKFGVCSVSTRVQIYASAGVTQLLCQHDALAGSVVSKYSNAPKRSACNKLRAGVSSCKMMFMNVFHPWQLLLVTLAGWINRHQQDVIAYVQEENRILKGKLKGKRIRFTNDERRRLAVKGKVLG